MPVNASISRRAKREFDFIIPGIGDDAPALAGIPV
jgi:hypothetical protein